MKKVLRGMVCLGLMGLGSLYWYHRETQVKKVHYDQVLEIKRGVPLGRSLSELQVADDLFLRFTLSLEMAERG